MLVLLSMFFLHIVNDFYFQGWLANGKQKQWWEINAPQSMYRYDYLCALFMHSFSWSFMVMIPIIFAYTFRLDTMFLICFISNIIIHFIVDHLKANVKKLNLIQDQCIHIVQIILTYVVLILI